MLIFYASRPRIEYSTSLILFFRNERFSELRSHHQDASTNDQPPGAAEEQHSNVREYWSPPSIQTDRDNSFLLIFVAINALWRKEPVNSTSESRNAREVKREESSVSIINRVWPSSSGSQSTILNTMSTPYDEMLI